MSLVRVYPVGYISMRDSGSNDEKIIAIPFEDPMYNTYKDLSDLPAHISEEISHFFNVYKHLEPSREAQVNGVFGRAEAVEVIKQAFENYIEKFCR